MSSDEDEFDTNSGLDYDPNDYEPEQPERSDSTTRNLWLLVGLLGVLVLVLCAVLINKDGTDNASSSAKKGNGSTTQQDSVSDNPSCPGFTIKLEPRSADDHDVIPGGVPANLSPEEKKDFIARHAKWDPSVFKSFFNDSPLVAKGVEPAITDPKGLATAWENGACWTETGQNLYNEWALYWKNVSAKAIPLPRFGTNTGSTGSDIFAVNNSAIPDGTATEFTYHDATNGKPIGSSKMRDQCGNIVRESSAPIPGVPNVPPGSTVPPVTPPPTSETPPPTSETPPPTSETPPPVLAPKDPSVDPYPQGNAPQGGGPNDQPGPGPLNVPTQPPATPRTNPPPPIATSAPGTPAPTRVSTPVAAPPPESGVNGNGTGTTTIPNTDATGGVTPSVVQTTTVPKPQ